MWIPYLESVCQYYAQWWKVYTLTDVRGKKSPEQRQNISPLLDLGLMVQTIESEEKQRERQEEKIERLTVLEGLRKYAPNHVLLVGRPGSGKSTALARLLLEEATKLISPLSPKEESPLSPPFPRGEIRIDTPPFPRRAGGDKTFPRRAGGDKTFPRGAGGDKPKIPILIELRYSQTSILSRIQAFIHKHHPNINIDTPTLETLLRQGQFLLLFDGFNEMASEVARQQVRTFRQDYPRTAMVFTTRDLSLGGDLGIDKRLEMQPLTESQMQEFVCAYLPEQGEKLCQQLQGRLRELGETPMFLWMLCDVFAHNNVVPANLGLVFRSFTQIYSGRLKQDVPVDESSRRWWDRLLQELAWVMTNGESKTEIMVAISRQKAEEALTEFLRGEVVAPTDCAMRWLEDLLEHHLIQVGDDGQISFRHQLLQEYYAAERLLWQLSGLSDYELQWDYLNYLKWTEVVALMLALVEDEVLAVRVVRLGLEVDWFLGARLVGEVQKRFQERAFVEVDGLELPVLVKVELAGLTKLEAAVSGLIKLLEDSEESVREAAAFALGEIGSDTATSGLIKLLEDSEESVREAAAFALGEIGSDTATSGLIKLLKDSEEFVREAAALALGEIGSDTATSGLIKLLKDSEEFVREAAAFALGEIGSETAIPKLIKLLKSSEKYVREAAAFALGEIGSETAIPKLIKLLKSSEKYVCEAAASALGKIGSETAIPKLIKILEDSNKDVRKTAVAALGQIGSDAAIPKLIKLLEDSNKDVVEVAAFALGKIGSETAIPKLIKLDWHIRMAYFLGANGQETATPGLTKLLENSNKDVPEAAAFALGKIGSETAISELIKFLKDSDSNLRNSPELAIVKIGSETATPGLIKLLEDSNKDVSKNPADALGEIGSETAISELIKLLKDSDSNLRNSAELAIVKIGSETAISELIKLLKDSDSNLREKATYLMGEIGSKTAIPALIKLLEKPEYDVCRIAVSAICKIGSETAIPELIKLIENSESDYDLRERAAFTIGNIGSEKSIIELTKKLGKDSFVKLSLSETIDAIQTIQQRLQYYKPTPKIPMSNKLSHNYALLIGVGNCKYPNWSLPVTVKDVEAIKSFLINPDLCGYIDNENYLRFLCNEQATKQNILDNLNWLQQQAKNDPEATILVYYSGHGWLDKSIQNYYLIPHDTSPVKLQKTALPATEFNNALQQISAQKLLVIIDSCHAQGMATAKETEELELPENFSQTALPKNLIEELRKGRGRAVFTSSTGEEKSYYREEMSIYTEHFLEALHGGGNKPGDKFVTVSNLMNYVGKTVPESAQQLGRKQTPIFDFSQTEDFPVALLCGGKGLPDGGWEEVKSQVRENISAGRDINSAGGDNTSQINVFGSSETTINIDNIRSKRSQ